MRLHNFTPLKQRAQEVLRAEVEGHPCLFIGFTQRQSKLSHIRMTEDSFTPYSKCPPKLGSYTPNKDGETGASSSLVIAFQRENDPRSLRKAFMGCKIGS